MPTPRETLFWTCETCSLNVSLLSITIPKYLKSLTQARVSESKDMSGYGGEVLL